MITPSLSGAQLDTIDVEELRDAVAIARAVDAAQRFSSMAERTAVLGSRSAHALIRAFAMLTEIRATAPRQRLEIQAPVFQDFTPIDFRHSLANPRAPIPEQLRRQNRPRW